MRVAFLTAEYPTEPLFAGGLASYLRRVCREVIAQGHEAEVFCLASQGGLVEDGSVRVTRVRSPTRWIGHLSSARYLWRYSGVWELALPSFALALTLWKGHRRQPFDLVQASNYRACGLLATYLPLPPVVTRVSSYEPLWRAGYQKPLTPAQRQIERLEMLQLRRSAACYAPSQLIAETVTRQEGVQVDVVEPPFALMDLPADDAYARRPAVVPFTGEYALFFGSIGRLKGTDRLLEVLPRVLYNNPDMYFLFIGSIAGQEGGRLKCELRSLLGDYAHRVAILPAQRHEVLLPIVRHARLVVLPSRIDNLPNACLEAMGLGRVVIGTRGASFEQLIEHGLNGFLVGQDDQQELAATIDLAWRLTIGERERIGTTAKASLERMRPDRAIANLLNYFSDVGAGRKHGGPTSPASSP